METMNSKAATRKRTVEIKIEADDSKQTLYAAPALEKGLDILELLSVQEHGLSRKDIADRLGRSVGEIFRMIECLTRRSYLVQTDDSFQLGMKLFELSHTFPPVSRLIAEALPRMRMLAKTVEQSCHLTVISGTNQLVVAQVDAPEGMGFSIKVGAKLEILKSASGRVLLAFQDEKETNDTLLLLGPNRSAEEINAIQRTLNKVRKDGFAFMKSNQFAGLQAISFPIFDLRGHAIAALTVPYVARLDDSTRMGTAEAQQMLGQVASELVEAVGGKPPSKLAARPSKPYAVGSS
ncbi:IclR family transcriptional regulator (plasmid) [Agrobacterium leguminum]|uniref:Transcriptional regulator, IclR family n=1 Tax=Agrobacterium deltaense NCPPB 1641 TaxID=1183425 RepID=A0A1S7U6W9_9HYPH|nr:MULTISPECIES: IclR family transcriptional regulator [Agrobacterium]WFS69801.1 IclR family transcriptional regulator [Agrobacterium leguminum]CVI62587.1 Transcriptional regulator, IclR family [Agrobacterium deltaense NCPPB 1641]